MFFILIYAHSTFYNGLKVGDIINGFDSLLFEPFTRRIESIVSSTSSSIILEVVATNFDDIYETYFFSADANGNSRKEPAIKSDRRRRLHSVDDIFGSLVSYGNASIISDDVNSTSDIGDYLADLAVDSGLQDSYIMPPDEISASTSDATSNSSASADIQFNTRVTTNVSVQGNSSNATISVDTTSDITTSFNQLNDGSGLRRSLYHNSIHDDVSD